MESLSPFRCVFFNRDLYDHVPVYGRLFSDVDISAAPFSSSLCDARYPGQPCILLCLVGVPFQFCK